MRLVAASEESGGSLQLGTCWMSEVLEADSASEFVLESTALVVVYSVF